MNTLDKIINWFDPEAGLARTRARSANNIMKRSYDAASNSRRNAGWNRKGLSGAAEASQAANILSATGQELCRNNPMASRIKHVWSTNVVGRGIRLDAISKNKRAQKMFSADFDKWAESTICDIDNHYNFYGLQWLWMQTIVETGGVFIRKIIKGRKLKLQTIEQTFLDRTKSGTDKNGKSILDGVQFNSDGSIDGYWIRNSVDELLMKTNDSNSKFYSADEIIHIFRKERSGQHLGITWLAQVATLLRNYDTYQDAKLMQQQVAACFAAIISDSDMTIGGEGSTPQIDSIEPAMVEYVRSGTEITQITPPKADNSTQFDLSLQRFIAAGSGITYEMLTGDYSQVNFASGRMGKVEFFNQLDFAQDLMMKPALNKVFEWYNIIWSLTTGINADVDPEWVFPPRAAVNPQEELDVLVTKVRNGFTTPSKASKLLGERFDKNTKQWKEDQQLMDDSEMIFDFDPRYFAKTGNQLNVDDAASANNESKTAKPETKQKEKKEVKK